MGERELETEHRALSALEQVPSLESWRAVIPVILERGMIGGRRYALERLVPGVDGRHFAGTTRAATMRLIADAIAQMYAHTTHQRSGDAVVAHLVEEPMAPGGVTIAGERLTRLRRRLEASLGGRQLQVARVYGDLWLGNAMLSADGAAVTGLVDWASSRWPGDGLPEGTRRGDLVLLAWLENIRNTLGGSRLWLPRLWVRRNVDAVLALV